MTVEVKLKCESCAQEFTGATQRDDVTTHLTDNQLHEVVVKYYWVN